MRKVLAVALLAAAGLAAQVNSIPATGGGTTVTQWGGTYQASSTSIAVAPYNHSVALHATGNCCTDFAHTGSNTVASFIVEGPNYRIRQSGLITSISFSWGNPTTTNQFTHLYFLVCSPSVSTVWSAVTGGGNQADCPVYSYRLSQDILPQLTAGAINTVTLNPPLYARAGDFYGFEQVGSFQSAGGAIDDRFYYENNGGNCSGSIAHCYILGTVGQLTQPQANIWSLSYGWQTDEAIPVQINMAAPTGVVIGDSILQGSTRYNAVSNGATGSAIPTLAWTDPTNEIGYYLQKATGWAWQNMGTGSQRSDQLAARFATDVVAMHPQWVLINAGVNDISQSTTFANFQTSWTSMLTAAQAAGIKPLCMLILPWTNGSNTSNTSADTWNAWLNGQCESYGGYTIDARPYVGMFRTGGNADNLWDIRPEYMSVQDNLKVHFSTLGIQQLAKAVLDRMGITNAFPYVQRRGQWFYKQQSQTASIASTTVYCNTDEPWYPHRCEAGEYALHWHIAQMTATNAGATVTASFTYKDAGLPGSSGNQYTITSGSVDLSGNNKVEEVHTIVLDGLTDPTFSTTYSGSTANYQVWATLERIN